MLETTTQPRKVSRILGPAHKHYGIAACIGPTLSATRSLRPVVDTGAGLDLVRSDVLPPNWETYAKTLTNQPRIIDANGNKVSTPKAIYLFVEAGGLRVFERFLVAKHLPGPCILGTEFISKHVEGILPRLRKIVWQYKPSGAASESLRHSPILATLHCNEWEGSWEDKLAMVRACKQVCVKGRSET